MSQESLIEVAKSRRSPLGRSTTFGFLLLATSALTLATAGLSDLASAATTTVGLGNATPFAVLAGTTVTNTGSTSITGSVGLSPGTAIVGFPPGHVTGGSIHAADAVALAAKAGLTTAYLDTAGRTPFTVAPVNLGGSTFVAGVYKNAAAMTLTGTVTLNGEGDPNSVFIFQAGSTLITATGSTVALIGGAQACNVFWQVGSSATIEAGTTFVGTIMALTSISLKTGATLHGRALARNGQVSLQSNVINRSVCAAAGGSTTTTSQSGVTTTTSNTTGSTIPNGAPGTGFGGTAHSTSPALWLIASATFVAGVAVIIGSVRRQRNGARSALVETEYPNDLV